MGTVAPPDEKQALADELAEARGLIDRGEYEAALDRLASAREDAGRRGDRRTLAAIWRLEGTVWRLRPSSSWRPGLGTWSLVVAIAWLVASAVVSVWIWATTEDDWLFSRGDLIAAAVSSFTLIAAIVWLLGLFLFLGWRRLRRPDEP